MTVSGEPGERTFDLMKATNMAAATLRTYCFEKEGAMGTIFMNPTATEEYEQSSSVQFACEDHFRLFFSAVATVTVKDVSKGSGRLAFLKEAHVNVAATNTMNGSPAVGDGHEAGENPDGRTHLYIRRKRSGTPVLHAYVFSGNKFIPGFLHGHSDICTVEMPTEPGTYELEATGGDHTAKFQVVIESIEKATVAGGNLPFTETQLQHRELDNMFDAITGMEDGYFFPRAELVNVIYNKSTTLPNGHRLGGTDEQVLIFQNEETKECVVAYRGTDTKLQWAEDGEAFQKPYEAERTYGAEDFRINWHSDSRPHVPEGTVGAHTGFLKVWSSTKLVVDALVANIMQDEVANWKLTFAGHSLGAAQATLATRHAATKFAPEQLACYTMGCPRAGNKLFAEQFDALNIEVWRMFNLGEPDPSNNDRPTEFDFVHQVPPPWLGGYEHVNNAAALQVVGAGKRRLGFVNHGTVNLQSATATPVTKQGVKCELVHAHPPKNHLDIKSWFKDEVHNGRNMHRQVFYMQSFVYLLREVVTNPKKAAVIEKVVAKMEACRCKSAGYCMNSEDTWATA